MTLSPLNRNNTTLRDLTFLLTHFPKPHYYLKWNQTLYPPHQSLLPTHTFSKSSRTLFFLLYHKRELECERTDGGMCLYVQNNLTIHSFQPSTTTTSQHTLSGSQVHKNQRLSLPLLTSPCDLPTSSKNVDQQQLEIMMGMYDSSSLMNEPTETASMVSPNPLASVSFPRTGKRGVPQQVSVLSNANASTTFIQSFERLITC